MEHVKTRWISGVENGFQVWELRLLWVRAPGEGKEWGAVPLTEKGAKAAVWF